MRYKKHGGKGQSKKTLSMKNTVISMKTKKNENEKQIAQSFILDKNSSIGMEANTAFVLRAAYRT